MILPPGTILQQMYFKERLRHIPRGRFVEVGTGQGIVSRTLLDLGWRGVAYDLNSDSLEVAAEVNRAAVSEGRYDLVHQDWLASDSREPADLIVSCMVLEHLADAEEDRYFERCKAILGSAGTGVLFVPGCPDYWGIEDEIAGHFRRYTHESLRRAVESRGLSVRHLAGLNYPISNLLFPISERLVRRAERNKAALSLHERTKLSGNRNVRFKTTFPRFLRIALNDTVMYPFHLLQKANADNPRSMVIYAEFSRARKSS